MQQNISENKRVNLYTKLLKGIFDLEKQTKINK